MILVKNEGKNTPITLQKPLNNNSTYYTILLQNTVTKEIYQFLVEEKDNNQLYNTFEINSCCLISGEYYLLLISNPTQEHIEVSYNNIESFANSNIDAVYFLLNKGDFITNGNIFIGIGKENKFKILTSELLKFGDYVRFNKEYNNEVKFITYNG